MSWTPEIHETHTGLVVLVGDRAYKTKRPVVTDFLDFSTVQRREKACLREVELNSRVAAQAYLGVAHLIGPGPDETEPVVVMRRYPDSARLSNRIGAAAATPAGEITAVAMVLARFHSGARRGAEIDAEATVSAVTRRWDANLREMERFAGPVISGEDLQRVADLAHRYLAGRCDLFTDRIGNRRIVDGHADLLADDIFWCDDGPVLLDCLDFDDRLRYVDGVDDAAFLAMDLEFLDRRDLAGQFLSDYRRFAEDPAPRSLADFYIAYRAVVRAKVDCIRVAQGHPEAATDAGRHLRIAVGHLRTAIPRLVLVGGGPGTGKTTVSRGLAEKIGAEVISTDEVRKRLLGDGAIEGAVGIVDSGLYTPERVAAVYDDVLRHAYAALAGGRSVVLDGTWRDPAQRRRAHDVTAHLHAVLTEIVCVTPLAVAQGRIAERTGSTSDATGEIAAVLAARSGCVGGWDDAHRLDTRRPRSEVVDEAEQLCLQGI